MVRDLLKGLGTASNVVATKKSAACDGNTENHWSLGGIARSTRNRIDVWEDFRGFRRVALQSRDPRANRNCQITTYKGCHDISNNQPEGNLQRPRLYAFKLLCEQTSDGQVDILLLKTHRGR